MMRESRDIEPYLEKAARMGWGKAPTPASCLENDIAPRVSALLRALNLCVQSGPVLPGPSHGGADAYYPVSALQFPLPVDLRWAFGRYCYQHVLPWCRLHGHSDCYELVADRPMLVAHVVGFARALNAPQELLVSTINSVEEYHQLVRPNHHALRAYMFRVVDWSVRLDQLMAEEVFSPDYS